MDDPVATALAFDFGFKSVETDDCGLGQGQTRRFRVTADGRRYIAKHLGKAVQKPSFECGLLQFLGEAGIPVAKNILTSKGEPFAAFDGRSLVLYEWAEGGVAWPAPPELASKLGSAVAAMHLASDSLQNISNVRAYDLDRLIDRPLRLLEPYSPDNSVFRRLT